MRSEISGGIRNRRRSRALSCSFVLITAVVICAALWPDHSGPIRQGAALAAGIDAGQQASLHRVPSLPFLGMTTDASAKPIPHRWWVVNAFPNLAFQDPTMLLPVPRSKKLCVIGREGTVEIFENDPDAPAKTMVLDIRDHCQGWDDSGLLGMAFHPEFGQANSPNRGYFYIWFNYSDQPTAGPGRPPHGIPTRDRLVRYTIPDGSSKADPQSAQILIDQADRDLWHNGGGMFFGADGFLYLSLGDEGNGHNSFGNAQRVDKSMFSGLIRIDVDEDASKSHPIPRQPINGVTDHYMIPNDNPWVGRPNTLEEFYCIGLRNPHRVTLDLATGAILCGEVGQDRWEEVDILKKAGNYQWAYREANHDGDMDKPSPPDYLGTDEPPIYEYEHSENNSVIGGYVYRGKKLPGFTGQYIFGDNTSGRIWRMEGWDTGNPTVTEIARMPQRGYQGLTSFGIDADCELYMCQLGVNDGKIFKLATDPPPDGPALPEKLSQTHAFTDTAALKPAPSLLAYDVTVPFWSDGAVKHRWIALPGSEPFDDPAGRINYSSTEAFKFPAGTVLVKHFDLAMDESKPQVTRRLETRVLVRGKSGGLYGATYRWRADGRDADRVNEEATEEILVATAQAVGPLQGADIGGAASAGVFHLLDRGCDMTTATAGINNAADGLSFASTDCTGQFDLRARLESLEAKGGNAVAGLMFRQMDKPGSPMIGVLARIDPHDAGKARLSLVQRQAADTPLQEIPAGDPISSRSIWLRLQRRDQVTFNAYQSSDGVNWNLLGSPARVYLRLNGRVGLLATAGGEEGASASASFRDLAWMRRQNWYYPSSFDCLSCHNQNAGMILGINARQLNREFIDPEAGANGNQLMNWWRIGMFSREVGEAQIAAAPRLTSLSNAHAPLEDRARSYLDVNCAYCHRGGSGGVGGYFDARIATPFDKQNLLTDQLRNSLGISGARVIAAGDPNHSVLLRRIRSTQGTEKMPPLGRNRVDADDAGLIEEWISSMPRPN